MSSEAALPGAYGRSPLAFLFTNDKAQIVYADSEFREIMKHTDGGLIGMPLHDALGLEQQSANAFFEEVRAAGTLEKKMLDLRTMLGDMVRVTTTSWASYHDDQGFVGVNVKLREVGGNGASEATSEIDESESLVGLRMAQALSGVTSVTDDMHLRLYATTQIEAVQVLLARLLGLGVHEKLEKKINKFAKKNNWPVSMTDGELVIEDGLRDAEAYRALLAEAVKYAEYLMGEGVAAAEQHLVDEQMTAETLELAGQYGMR